MLASVENPMMELSFRGNLNRPSALAMGLGRLELHGVM